MKQVKFVPSVCKGDEPQWLGEVIIRSPTFDEKGEFYDHLNIEHDENGEVAGGSTKSNVKFVRTMVKLSKDFYVSVDLRSKDGLQIAKSYEDLQDNEELHGVLGEVAMRLIGGAKLGNG